MNKHFKQKHGAMEPIYDHAQQEPPAQAPVKSESAEPKKVILPHKSIDAAGTWIGSTRGSKRKSGGNAISNKIKRTKNTIADSDEKTLVSMLLMDTPPESPAFSESRRTSMEVDENAAAISKPAIDEISDDDLEDDQSCAVDGLILPSFDDVKTSHTKCSVSLCNYNAKGWKQLTKHYVRQHPGIEIPNSYLPKKFDAHKLILSFNSIVAEDPNGMLIHSVCYFCCQSYKMCSEKWLMHFIAHTG